MRVEISKGFLTSAEAEYLTSLAIRMNDDRVLIDGKNSASVNKPGMHKVSRYTSGIVFDPLLYKIKNRAIDWLGASEELFRTEANGHDFVVNCSFKGASMIKHRDMPFRAKAQLRCVVLSNKPELGGDPIIEGNKIELKTGDMYAFLASEHTHYVTENLSDDPRVCWQFSFATTPKIWNNYESLVQ